MRGCVCSFSCVSGQKTGQARYNSNEGRQRCWAAQKDRERETHTRAHTHTHTHTRTHLAVLEASCVESDAPVRVDLLDFGLSSEKAKGEGLNNFKT